MSFTFVSIKLKEFACEKKRENEFRRLAYIRKMVKKTNHHIYNYSHTLSFYALPSIYAPVVHLRKRKLIYCILEIIILIIIIIIISIIIIIL